MHRAVIAGNFNAIKLVLDSPLYHEAYLIKDYLPVEARRQTIIEMNALDYSGKSARDYSHKIVFIAKLLN